MRELRVEDALLYLDQVKVEFGDRPHIYNEFLDIMKTFKTQQIDTPGVIRRVSNLFQGNRKLVLGFNTFLPEGYKIELPLDGDGVPVAVFRAPGKTVTHILSGPGAPTVTTTGPGAGITSENQGAAQKPAATNGSVNRGSMGVGPIGAGQAALAAHSNQALGPNQRGMGGSMMQHVDRSAVSAPGPGYAAHAPQGVMHMQQRGQLGQTQQMMPGADAAARARLEQQALGAAANSMASRGSQVAAQGMSAVGQPRSSPEARGPDSRLQAAPHHHHPGLMQQNQGHLGMHGAAQPVQQALSAVAAPPPAPQRELGQPLEFDHAINYVTTIKKRFSNEPETYKKFLEILHTYQKEQRGIKEVLEEVSVLFSEHPDLLKEFTYFLPEAVQAEAKAQLEIVAQEAEERKKAAEAAKLAAAPMRPQPTVPPVRPPVQPPHIPVPATQLPVSPRIVNPVPFGATHGRSVEREREIYRSAVYGTISFAPARPPRKTSLSVKQAVSKNGRPSMLPPLPIQPTTAETVFFEKAKSHLNRRELAPDKPSGTRRHTPYTEFLKCLHLFGAGVLNKDELMLLLRGLFVQGHAPKSGANAGGGAQNPDVASDAHNLLKEFEQILIGRGPYAKQESAIKDKSKYGTKQTKQFDFRDCERPTPSYATYPSDYPTDLFMEHTGQTKKDEKVLNRSLVCVGAEKKRKSSTPEEYDAIRERRNAYEEAMFRIEDERFEVDMAIERNALAMRHIEPIAEEVTMLRENEEKDGQPIGRLQYKLNARTLNSIQINAVGRIYGDNGDEVIGHLARNPLAVLPIVYQRLRQKDQEWRKQKSELMSKWKASCEANYEGSMDFQCYFKRRDLERSLAAEKLLDECQHARSYCSSPEKQAGSSASFGLSSPDRSAVLYEPYAVVDVKPESPAHRTAVRLLIHQVVTAFDKSDQSGRHREMVGRIWMEFMVPFFNYPVHWVQDEARESFGGKLNGAVVQYSTGQQVRTAFGDGTVLSFIEGEKDLGPRYRIKFPFGIGFISASSIAHGLHTDGVKYVRSDGCYVKDDEKEAPAIKLDQKFTLLFGTESIYVFIRLYSGLVSLLDDVQAYCFTNPTMADPAKSYHNPMESADEKLDIKLNFSTMISKLQKVISKKLSAKDFEAYCRRMSPEMVHKMSALPKIIEQCADCMRRTAVEDLLLPLFDFCKYPESDPVLVRSKCLSLSPEVAYRIQLNASTGRLYFSYLPDGEVLSTAPLDDDDDDDDDDDEVMEGPDASDDEIDDDDDIMDVEDEEEDLRQVKRMKVK
eukprot:scaffold2214_cov139-Cylindrotheca_fusiformis.AAC.25